MALRKLCNGPCDKDFCQTAISISRMNLQAQILFSYAIVSQHFYPEYEMS